MEKKPEKQKKVRPQKAKPQKVKTKKDRKVVRAVVIAVVVVLIAASCAALYLFGFQRITIAADNSFLQVIPSSDLMKLRLDFALHGKRLSVVKLKDEYFSYSDLFQAALSLVKGDVVVLSPMVSEYAIDQGVDVSSLLADSLVIGISMKTDDMPFDCTLVPDELSGWLEASSAIEAEISRMSQNVALIYSSGDVSYAQDIIDAFPTGHVTEFRKMGRDGSFAMNTLAAMDEQGIVIALCPYVSTFYRFFNNETTTQWVVDYRFASVVPENNLYAVVIPDLSVLMDISQRVEKGSRSEESLPYIYVKR